MNIDENTASLLIQYARELVDSELNPASNALCAVPDCGDLEAGAFVSIEIDGNPCGFVGSITQRPVVESVRLAALMALSGDPRYDISQYTGVAGVRVWLTGETREISGSDQLCDEDGVMVISDLNRAVYLPDRKGLAAGPEGILAAACVLADLHPRAWERPDVKIWAFSVSRLDGCSA